MGKSAPSPPPAPDPVAVSNAQAAANEQTARVQAMANRVNQYTPQGNLVYTQDDPNNPDKWSVTQSYSPTEQHLFDLSTQAQGVYGQTALNQLGQAAGSLSTPINTDYSSVRDQYINSQMGLIQPQLDQQQQDLESKLAAQGVAQGSTAYQNAMRDFSNQKSSMYANILAGAGNQVGQSIQQQIALRDQPLNEASALLTGSQVSQPQFTNVPQTTVAPTDVLGAYNLSQNAQNLAYQSQMQQYGSTLGGMGGLVGSLGGAALLKYSDERLKTDIKQVGTLDHPGGPIPIKTFRFKGSPIRHMGLVAQDVEKADPAAVAAHPVSGMKGVHYARVLMGAAA